MSKRKGRRKPLTSEIKSVMRAPTDLDGRAEDALDAELRDAPDLHETLQPPADDTCVTPDPDSRHVESEGPEGSTELDAAAPPAVTEAEAADAADAAAFARDALEEEALSPTEPESDAAAVSEPGRPPRNEKLRAVSDLPQKSGASSEPAEARTLADYDADPDEAEEDPRPRLQALDDADIDDTEAFLSGLIEALLFTSQRPLPLKDIARSAGVDQQRAQELLERLIEDYAPRGLCVEEVAGGFVMRSSARYAPYIQKILSLRPIRLSRAQLETLAIVAYRQPVTKPEVDDIRGVDSGQVIKGLLERALLKIMGKKDEPGRPMLYGTTTDFLELLNLQSLKDLPTLREYTELSEESQRKFMEETGEEAPIGAALDGDRLDEAPADGTAALLDPTHEGDLASAASRATGEGEGENLDAIHGDADLDPGAQPESLGSRHSPGDPDAPDPVEEDEDREQDHAEASASTAPETSSEDGAIVDTEEHDSLAESGELTDEMSGAPESLGSDENAEDLDTETAETTSNDAAPDAASEDDDL